LGWVRSRTVGEATVNRTIPFNRTGATSISPRRLTSDGSCPGSWVKPGKDKLPKQEKLMAKTKPPMKNARNGSVKIDGDDCRSNSLGVFFMEVRNDGSGLNGSSSLAFGKPFNWVNRFQIVCMGWLRVYMSEIYW